MAQKELCFVWGPPLSGQRCWMARAAGETDENIKVSLLPIENYSQPPELPEILASLEKLLAEKTSLATQSSHHIYCELPWGVVEDAFMLEDWLSTQPLFKDPKSGWSLGFTCLCPNDSDRLPENYRIGLEEFSRASHSTVIVLKVEGDEGNPYWLENDIIDFGRNVEVFEEVLWPKPEKDALMPVQKSFEIEDFEFLTLPYIAEPANDIELFRALERGEFGEIWGAELFWKNSRGQFEALSLTQGRVFDWVSNHMSLVERTFANGALLNIAGRNLRSKEIEKNLKPQLFS